MTTDELVELRNAFAAGVGAAPTGCAAPETIWAASRGELPPAAVREVVDHTAACPSCAADWRLAVAFREESGEVERIPAAAPARPFAFARLVRTGGLAAAAALVVAVAGITLIERPEPVPDGRVFRQGEGLAIRSLVPAGEVLSHRHCVLIWTGAAWGSTYDLEILTEDYQLVANPTGLTLPAYRVPERALSGLPSPTTLYWQVRVTTPAGRVQASETFKTPVS